MTPVYKNKSKNSKDNCRPVSILYNISKIYERCFYGQIQVFFNSILSKYQCGLQRGYNAQHCLITLVEKWKKSVNKCGASGALFTDLSEAFDWLSHELLIAKLDAYRFDKNASKLVNTYLSNRKQRVIINDKCCSWSQIIWGSTRFILKPFIVQYFHMWHVFFFWKTLISLFMLAVLPHVMPTKILNLLLIIKNIRHQFFLNGLTITKWT